MEKLHSCMKPLTLTSILSMKYLSHQTQMEYFTAVSNLAVNLNFQRKQSTYVPQNIFDIFHTIWNHFTSFLSNSSRPHITGHISHSTQSDDITGRLWRQPTIRDHWTLQPGDPFISSSPSMGDFRWLNNGLLGPAAQHHDEEITWDNLTYYWYSGRRIYQ